VKAGAPVILFLSAYNQTHWKLTVEKGASLKKVTLLGSSAMELSGTDAPMEYLAATWPDGKRTGNPGFNATKMGTIEYDRLVSLVKEQTGKELTNFHGQYESRKEPFVITPTAK
jgi:hypothetical protein